MTARIVFADGSKAMAHNTNDLMFRWHERKSYEPVEIVKIHRDGISIRDCSQPSSEDEANAWRVELLQQKSTLQSQIHALRKSSSFKAYKHPHMFGALNEIDCQLIALTEELRKFKAQREAEKQTRGMLKRAEVPLPSDPVAAAELATLLHNQKMERIAGKK